LYLSGVLWPITILSEFPIVMKIMQLNPLYYLIEGYRASLLGQEWYILTHWQLGLYFWGLVFILLMIGSNLHIKFIGLLIDCLERIMKIVEKAIILKNISKKYKLYISSKERLFDLLTPKEYGNDFYALKNVNFTAYQGEVIGFVGINGSGKSTLSNIIAGIVPQTLGDIDINGEVSLIAVSAGLKNDLTGRDNIEMKLLMLGFNKKEIQDLEPNIIEFSELGEFIDQP